VWHHLNTAQVERAKLHYRELFGWEFEAITDLGELAY
jgi:predicted enzyme related to lactoylglutathione lyase